MKLGGHQRSQSWILLALLALGNLGGPLWEFITILLFKGPAVWGALCALSSHHAISYIGLTACTHATRKLLAKGLFQFKETAKSGFRRLL